MLNAPSAAGRKTRLLVGGAAGAVVAVLLVAVLYVLTSGIVGTGCGCRLPTVVLSQATALAPGGNDWEFRVAAIDQIVDLGRFRVSILRGTSIADGPVDLASGHLILGTLDALHLNTSDLDSDGRLSAGDAFVLGNAASGSVYHLVIVWKASGGEIARRTISP